MNPMFPAKTEKGRSMTKLRAIWAIIRGGSVAYHVNITGNLDTDRNPSVIAKTTIEHLTRAARGI